MRKTPLWLKRLPLIGKHFWNARTRDTAIPGVSATGVMTTHWHGPNGEGGHTIDGDGDVVRRWGAPRPFAREPTE